MYKGLTVFPLSRLHSFFQSHMYLLFALLLFPFVLGVLDTRHLAPDSTDLLVNLYVALYLGLGLALSTWLLRPKYISRQVYGWGALLLLLLLQPALNRLSYLDSLVFPLGCISLCIILAWTLSGLNQKNKKILADVLAYALLAAGCLTVLTQFFQALGWHEWLKPYVFGRGGGSRLIGNIAQVNQAVFVAAMALATLPYLYYTRPGKIRNIVYMAAAFWLCLSFGFGASRGGLILALAAVFSSMLFYAQSGRKRIGAATMMLVLAVGGYALGTYWLNLWVSPELSAVGRFVAGNQNLRLSQLAQAWHAFSHHPISGVGYGMIKGHGLDHAEEIPWFTIGHHVHNIVGQIAAELGLLGLAIFAYFLWIIIRNFQWRGMQPEKGLAYGVLLIIGLYSLSEYPLWFLRFLMLVPICLALIDDSARPAKWQPYGTVVTLSVTLAFGAWFYANRYLQYSMIFYYVSEDNLPEQELMEAYHHLPVVFGLHNFRDMMLYEITGYDTNRLDAHIALGERSLKAHFTQDMLIKQANLYALAGNTENAGKYYRAACVQDFSQNCNIVIEHLQFNADKTPNVFGRPLADFSAWYQNRFGKVLPKSNID